MSRVRRFGFSFTVNNRFVADQPDAAVSMIEAQMRAIANRETAIGPRGGTYRLDPAEPLVWQSSDDFGLDFIRNLTRWTTRRTGRYIRPNQAPPVPEIVTYETVTIPVVAGAVTLPNGQRIESSSKYVDVPVLV